MPPQNNQPADRELTLRQECWNAALEAYGTAAIFERRSRLFRRLLQWVSYIGFIVPMTIGLLVLGYGQFKGLAILIAIAVAIGIGQVAMSLWSVIGGWVDDYSYATKSASANHLLSDKYSALARNPPAEMQDLLHEYDKLQIEDRLLQEQDYRQGVNEAEKRMGMRAALRSFGRECAGCSKVPTSMRPTDCDICGNFRYRVK